MRYVINLKEMDPINYELDVDYGYKVIKRICEEVGPGVPGSPQERARAEIVKEEMEKSGFENVHIEDFTHHPMAFLGWFKLGTIIGLTAAVLVIFGRFAENPNVLIATTIIGFLLASLLVAMVFMEFFYYKEFVDFLYPKKQSENVIGTVYSPDLDTLEKKKSDVKHIVIFSGHHDSAWAFRWLEWFGFGYYIAMVFIFAGVISVIITNTIQLVQIIMGIYTYTFGSIFDYFMVILMPLCAISAWFFIGSGKNGGTVPGANDNLSGVVVAMMIGRYLKVHPNLVPKNTEIRLISFGAEEAGTRGARAYVKAHLQELKEKDAIVLNYDSMADTRVSIFTSDRNNTLKLDHPTALQVQKAAVDLNINHVLGPFPVFGGGTDSLPFGENAIKTVGLYAMKLPQQMCAWYHQPGDNITVVNKEALKISAKLGLHWLLKYFR